MDTSASVRVAAIDQATTPLRQIAKAFKGLDGEAKTSLARIGRAMAETKKQLSLKSAQDDLKKYTYEWKRQQKTVTKGFSSIKLALVGAASGVTAWFTALAGSGDATAKVADKLGLTTDQLQKFRYAADRGGVSQNEFDVSMQRFTRRISEARQGTGVALKAFQGLGITLKNNDGTAKSSSQLFSEVADKLKRVKNGADKVSLAFKFFDSGGVKMLNMMKGGSQDIKALGKELEDMGGILDEKALRGSEGFIDNMCKMQNLIKGFAGAIFGAILPQVSAFVDKMFQWGKANRELVVDKVVTFLKSAGSVLEGFASEISNIIKFIQALLPEMDGATASFLNWAMVGRLVAGVLGGLLALKLANFIKTLLIAAKAAKAFMLAFAVNPAAMLNPLTLITAAIVAIAAGAYLVWRNWDEVKKWFIEFWDNWGDWIITALGPIAWITKAAIALWQNWDEVFQYFKEAWDSFSNGVGEAVTTCKNYWNNFIEALDPAVLLEKGKNLVSSFWDGIKARWQALKTWLFEAVRGLTDWMPDSIKEKLGLNFEATATATTTPTVTPVSLPDSGTNAAQAAAAMQNKSRVDGNIRIEVKAPQGTEIKEVSKNGETDIDLTAGVTVGGYY